MIFNHKKIIVPILCTTLLILSSCAPASRGTSSKRVTATVGFDAALADSILKVGLDHEALYTLVSGIKPMSSLIGFTLPFEIDSAQLIKGHAIDLEKKAKHVEKIKRYTSVLKGLDLQDLDFVLVPFSAQSDSIKSFQINVIRKSRLEQVIDDHLDFFAYMGIVPGTDPGIVLSTVENQEQIIRLRAYGYLFGYPDYAVDFFVEAYHQSQQTKTFVERDFFQIPVFTRKTGHFVYAMPKTHTPTETDSVLFRRAMKVLDRYKDIRPQYFNADSTFQSLKLIRKLGE
ncbi:hypothetical protein [Allomuricauda sp. F6463D]|uniref:hypothetical protein n=1 Tax=Allomuricauda sp. F6463D TaxID=2926409 RepID=UPI001FF16DAB|nr:hypothetical protein [Muricauda sp. F6463D]MCK0159994.1 hypothetical protein [Muricauda sp. F6463D]